MLVVPIIISFLFKVGGVFLTNTNKAYKTGFEKRGPICMNSINLSMSSSIISES
jgi:hypothetical protein